MVNVPIVDDKLGLKLFGAQIKSDGLVYNTTLKKTWAGDDVAKLRFRRKMAAHREL